MKLVELPQHPIEAMNLAGGQWTAGAQTAEVISPYTGSVVGRVPMATAAEVGQVVAGARDAAEAWRRVPAKNEPSSSFDYASFFSIISLRSQISPRWRRALRPSAYGDPRSNLGRRPGFARGYAVRERSQRVHDSRRGCATCCQPRPGRDGGYQHWRSRPKGAVFVRRCKVSRFGQGDITCAGGVEPWSQQKKITSKWALQPDMNWMS